MPTQPQSFQTLKITKYNLDKLRQDLVDYPFFLSDAASKELIDVLGQYRQEMQDRSSKGPLKKQSGSLMRSWAATVEKATVVSKVRGSLASFAGYSIIHEEGQTVYGKPWIYIPSNKNQKANGQALFTPKEVLNKLNGKFSVINNKNVIVDQDNEIYFFLVRWARYLPQLEFFKRKDGYADKMTQQSASRLVQFWKG